MVPLALSRSLWLWATREGSRKWGDLPTAKTRTAEALSPAYKEQTGLTLGSRGLSDAQPSTWPFPAVDSCLSPSKHFFHFVSMVRRVPRADSWAI